MLVVVLLLAACTTASPSPEFAPPVWTRQPAPSLPYERLQDIRGVAGWNGGFVVAGLNYLPPRPDVVEVDREVPVLHMSSDGETWREMPVPGIQAFALGQPAAGHGDHGYVLGDNDSGPVLLTLEGDTWIPLRLPGATAEDRAVSIAAGPRGVMVVSVGRIFETESETAKIWHSADGRTFSGPVSPADTAISASDARCLVATERGFLLPMSDGNIVPELQQIELYESADGRTWTVPGAEFPEPAPNHHLFGVEAVQYNHGVTVAFGTMLDSDGAESVPSPIAWSRRDGEEWKRIDLDPGRLPDAGVEPADLRYVFRVPRWRDGFLALGVTNMASGVWTSPDGVAWHRTPVRDNGFEATHQLQFATDGRTSLVLQQSPGKDRTGPTTIWRAR
jgi:hypothetical protein